MNTIFAALIVFGCLVGAVLLGKALRRLFPEEAITLATDFAQLRSLLVAQSVASISKPMLIILVSWLVVIFLGFSVLAPPNATVMFALMVSALAVSGAIFLILELDQPFAGLFGSPASRCVTPCTSSRNVGLRT
jgi:hypothetical protein